MSSETIYARVPTAMKEAIDTYATERGTKLTSAVVDLLGRGLEAVADEKSINDLLANLARTTAEKADVEAELVTARAQLATLSTFADRAGQRVGTCPSCSKPITGADLFAVTRCPACKQPLTELLAPKAGAVSTLDQREMLLLVGALGAVLAIAYLSTKK
ncbi:hypothetical protein ACFO1B_06455 [Dactylosporangium siamense]|uniref:Uncharacterized protein n=1 Tax=Dactylosporangium siamense TaxID=685454 RepID=A0A919PK04_9ACTN|nr:hypothetical protein [Dactylosporangium siamense]GIG43398.1 hypothetical protein Dsi01nite_014390 [Dactylosporangium siamense]